MPIKRRKDTSRLVAKTKLWLRQRPQSKARTRHYWNAYLWADVEAMRAATGGDGNSDPNTLGLHCSNEWTMRHGRLGWRRDAPPLLGEIHLLKDKWTDEIVSHECAHAMIQYLRTVGPPIESVLLQDPVDAEEAACFALSDLFQDLFHWLWKVNPHGKHA